MTCGCFSPTPVALWKLSSFSSTYTDQIPTQISHVKCVTFVLPLEPDLTSVCYRWKPIKVKFCIFWFPVVLNHYVTFSRDRKMALIQMSTVEEAIQALIDLHNYNMGGNQHLRVSFSKSTIWECDPHAPDSTRIYCLGVSQQPFRLCLDTGGGTTLIESVLLLGFCWSCHSLRDTETFDLHPFFKENDWVCCRYWILPAILNCTSVFLCQNIDMIDCPPVW